ncbi:hypothetical protein HGRIS_012150 [Hohenbuehelia grisea]|uniref:Cap64 protein n=1 Tax=Hohenbuehelia grisea TaxID=104357 RepID=A0ABR3IRI1_9AGAR
MGSDANPSEKLARLSQRNLGLTNRVWLIITFVLAVLTISHYVLPSTSLPSYASSSSFHSLLRPKNYVNASDIEPNPFAFCPLYGPGDELGNKYGALSLSQSRMHLGSGARLQRVLQRALMGQPVTISVLGGSISACHGSGDDPVSSKCYPAMFFNWWNSIFPHPATELTNGAMRRTNSAYFGFCSAQHIPDVTDLVIIELDVDDTPDPEMMEHFETLIRSILIRPDQPAIIILGHFSPQIQTAYGFAGPDHWHNLVAQFYDVPHISVKPALLPSYLASPPSISKYYVDPILASQAGHQVIADILISYIQSQVCAAWDVAMGVAYDSAGGDAHGTGVFADNAGSGAGAAGGLFGGLGQRKGVPGENPDDKKTPEGEVDPLDPDARTKASLAFASNPALRVPPARINTPPPDGSNSRTFMEISPFCVSANDLINPLPPSLFFGSGWFVYHPSNVNSHALNAASHYFYSTLPTSKLRIPIQVQGGDIGVYYVKDKAGAPGVGEGSAVECWVDDNYRGAKTLESAGDRDGVVLEMIDHHVGKGSHFVECQLLGEEGEGVPAFKIVGVFAT